MTKLPFDEKLSTLLDSYCEIQSGAGWRLLMKRDTEIFQYLDSNGYSRQEIERKLTVLQEIPAKELLRIGLAVEHMFNPVKHYLALSSLEEVFEETVRLCRSMDPDERFLGVFLLRRKPGRSFVSESREILLEMLGKEGDAFVVVSLIHAVNEHLIYEELSVEEVTPTLLSLASHEEDCVRQAVATALCGIESEVVATLINLSRDPSAEVRNWATWSLVETVSAVQTEVYSDEEIGGFPDLRDVFMDRVNDENRGAHIEAIRGLALYRDSRVLKSLKKELQSEDVSSSVLEAASTMADPELFPILAAIKHEHVSWDHSGLKEAIESCKPEDMS